MLSKDTFLTFKRSSDQSPIIATGLIDVPPMIGDRNMIDVTDLSHECIMYEPGLKDPGDLPMKFIYDNSKENSPYRVFRTAGENNEIIEFVLSLPDGTTFTYSGIPTVSIDDITVNDKITFTCKVALKSDVVVQDPNNY